MLYLDTSSLLKIFFSEPESDAVDAAFEKESDIIITTLTELEALSQMRARKLAGLLPSTKYNRALRQFELLRDMEAFVFQPLPGQIFFTALRQHRKVESVHCRSLDRLHLAAMEELGITRLMTHDARQAAAARALGFEVITPSGG